MKTGMSHNSEVQTCGSESGEMLNWHVAPTHLQTAHPGPGGAGIGRVWDFIRLPAKTRGNSKAQLKPAVLIGNYCYQMYCSV